MLLALPEMKTAQLPNSRWDRETLRFHDQLAKQQKKTLRTFVLHALMRGYTLRYNMLYKPSATLVLFMEAH